MNMVCNLGKWLIYSGRGCPASCFPFCALGCSHPEVSGFPMIMAENAYDSQCFLKLFYLFTRAIDIIRKNRKHK
jgi:hypothetical protein